MWWPWCVYVNLDTVKSLIFLWFLQWSWWLWCLWWPLWLWRPSLSCRPWWTRCSCRPWRTWWIDVPDAHARWLKRLQFLWFSWVNDVLGKNKMLSSSQMITPTVKENIIHSDHDIIVINQPDCITLLRIATVDFGAGKNFHFKHCGISQPETFPGVFVRGLPSQT